MNTSNSSEPQTLASNPLTSAPPDLPDSPWHVELEGARKGPMTTPQVIALIQAGQLTRDSLSWRTGQTDWVALSKTVLASHFEAAPPALPGSVVPNGLVWTLAFAPLLGAVLAGFLGAATRTSFHSYWWVTLALNVGLSLLDERRLRAAGHDTQKMGGAWLVPVYLYKRAQVLRHNLAYFIVWVVCFVLTLGA